MDRILQMIINSVLRQVVNRGVNAGFSRLSGSRKSRNDMEPDVIDGDRATRDAEKRARQAANLARKLGR